MVLFGELVIPSSRALWDDDFDQLQTEHQICLEWRGDTSIPTNISNILMLETSRLNNIAISCIESEGKPLCCLVNNTNAIVEIYKLKCNNYLILCSETKGTAPSPGEVIEMLVPWFRNTERMICITSNSSAMFHKNRSEEMPSCFIKTLSVVNTGGENQMSIASVLDVPNLVTGLCAGAISYCHHMNKSGVLYVCYMDHRPLDSLIAVPILDLLNNLNITTDRPFSFKPEFVVDSNLYM